MKLLLFHDLASVFIFSYCDIEILAKFTSKIEKLVKIALKKHISFQNLPDVFVQKSENSLKKKTLSSMIL
jgi:hypothetical protein